MKQLLIALSALCLLSTANAKVISGNTQFVKIDVKSVVLEVSAKCKSPKFEDDTFQVFFSDESYAEVSSYQKSGYSYKLLDKNCGSYDATKVPLSSKDYETVQILMVNTSEAQEILNEAIKNAWSSAL
jgi:hypothetical protein